MIWDRFDIVSAHYIYCVEWHGGQWSAEYARLCRIRRYFRPSGLLSVDTLTDNARLIYDVLVASRA